MRYGEWAKRNDDDLIELGPENPLSWLYRQVWSRLGGRPYTYMLRDLWHQIPLAWIFFILFIGTVLGHLFW